MKEVRMQTYVLTLQKPFTICEPLFSSSGLTREDFDNKKVVQLEYEAYIPMAEKEMNKICHQIRQKWGIKHIAIFHRLGYE